MSDETPREPDAADEAGTDSTTESTADSSAERPARPPSPSATAASRARRIGGRPLPGPRPDGDATAAAPAKAGKAAKSTSLDKPAKAREPKPAREPRPARGSGSDVDAIRRQLDRLRWVPAAVAAAALAAVLGLGVWQSHGVWWGDRFHDTRSQQQQQVLATAKSCAAAILSYDYRKLDDAQKAGLACTTGAFGDDYVKTIGVVQQSAPKLKAVQTLQIAKGGVQSVSKDGKQWVVLLYGQTAFTRGVDKTPTPRIDIASAVLTLDRVGSKWLVSQVRTGG